MVNKKRLIKLAQKLIQIDSQNPPGDEAHIASFVKDYLEDIGIEAKIYAFQKRRTNVVAHLGAKGNGRVLLITPHLDTVPKGKSWNFKPFSGKIRRGKIYGLGATDCKGNLACALEAMQSIVEDQAVLRYNLVFAATADEESGSVLGLIPLLDKGILKPDLALVLDADDFGIIVAQKGLLHFKVKLQGKKAHGAYPWRGVNAIDLAARIIQDLRQHKFRYRKNQYLMPPTVNIGTIKGGDKVNVVADWCELELDLRFLPGMSGKKVLAEVKEIIRRHTHKFQIEIEGTQAPYQIEENHPLVRNLIVSMRRMQIRPTIKGSEGATTISLFQDKHIPAVATGFGAEGCAHSADEYAKVDNLYKGACLLDNFLKSYRFS